MRSPDSRRRALNRLAMAVAAIGLFSAAYYWGNQYKRVRSAPPTIDAVLIRPAVTVAAFRLRDATGRPFTADDLEGHWTLLSFGEVSQASGHQAVTRLIEVHNRLAGDPHVQGLLQIVLAHHRQAPGLARDFTSSSGPLALLSGEPGDLQRLRTSVGAPGPEATETKSGEPSVYLIGPSRRLLALFPGSQEPASIASDLSAIAKHMDSLYPADA